MNSLTMNETLTAASVAHDTDMACHDFSDHRGTDGSDWFGRISSLGYDYAVALEKIYNGDLSIGYVLSPDRKPSDSTYPGYYTAIFASPR